MASSSVTDEPHTPTPDAESTPADDARSPEPSLWALARSFYFTFDRRTLGFTRILVGFLFVMDALHRATVWMDMYSSKGVLPTHLNLQRPMAFGAWSIFNAFETPGECVALWCVMFATFFCLFIGYKTKIAQVLSMIFVVSMNGRVLLIENGGYVVHNLLAMWTCFLPMGDRFSVDAMLASMRRRKEATAEDLNDRVDLIPEEKRTPHVTLLGPVLLLQISAFYFFNYFHKTGPAWHNGTAVHFVLYVDRMVTPIIGLTRDYIPNWVIIILTRTTMAFELGLAFVLFCPLARTWARRAAVVMINFLHVGFGTAMVLGPFAWACCIFSTLLFSTDDWDLAVATMRRERRARRVLYDRRSGAALWVCRVLARLDRFELLTFFAADDIECGLRVVDSQGNEHSWTDAIADIVEALPLGPCVAWLFRVPGGRHMTLAILEWIERHDMSRLLGLSLPSRSVFAPPRSAVRRAYDRFLAGARELGVFVMFAGAVNQAAVELWVVNRHWHVPQPEPMRLLALKLRFLQGWFMFSPNPVMDDGTLVVDALTADGRHIDPFTGKAPDFDLLHAKSFAYTQIWCDYYNRIHLPANSAYRDAMKDYMYRYPERTGRPEDEIVSGEVYWIQDLNPRWGDTKSYKYEELKLFSFEHSGVHSPPPATGSATPPVRPVGPIAPTGPIRSPE